jgi:CBS domain containing-hemolysin-like protein
MSSSLVAGIIVAWLLIAANAFFVAAEFALIASRRRAKGEQPEEAERETGQLARARRDLNRPISGTQLGITVSSLGLGWLGVSLMGPPLAEALQRAGLPLPSGVGFSLAVVLAVGVVAFFQVLFGDLMPRVVALASPDRMARLVAPPLNGFNLVMGPFLWVLNKAAAPIASRGGVSVPGAHGRVHSPEEIEILLRQSRVEGVVEEDEEEMIHGVFELTRTVAREVMTPRLDIVAFPETAILEDVLDTAATSGYSRFPVYRESIDDVTGVVLMKDLLRWIRGQAEEPFSLTRVMREPFFVPDTKPVDDLLAEFRDQKLHLAVVVDEFGGTDGLVTLEDLVEEIVGDIFDEHDVAQQEIVLLPDGRGSIEGGADPADVIEQFGLGDAEEAEEYDTVAGFVIGELGRIPEIGETVRLGAAELRVSDVMEQRVTRLELRMVAGEPDPEPLNDDAAR